LAGSQGILFLLAWQLIAAQKACQSPHPRRAAIRRFLMDVAATGTGCVQRWPVVGARQRRARSRLGVSPRDPSIPSILSTLRHHPISKVSKPPLTAGARQRENKTPT